LKFLINALNSYRIKGKIDKKQEENTINILKYKFFKYINRKK